MPTAHRLAHTADQGPLPEKNSVVIEAITFSTY
jgi:hypothetical protein